MKFRTYHEVTGSDASAIGPQVSRQQQRIEERLARVGLLVGVMSGKGGVGKTYVTAGLALAFGERGLRVGVLDADLAAPTAARVLGASGPVAVDEEGVRPATGRVGPSPIAGRSRSGAVRLFTLSGSHTGPLEPVICALP